MPILLMRAPDEIHRDIRADGAYRKIYDGWIEKTAYWMGNFSDDPTMIGGWGHHYVCPECGNGLKYDRLSPDAHLCPACGKTFCSGDIKNAWNEARRFDIADAIGTAAILSRLENAGRGGCGGDYIGFIKRVVGWYADHYGEFEEHGHWVGLAKAMGHTLSEAIWGIRLIEALMSAGIDPSCADALYYKKKLFVPMLRLIMSQPTNLMNISLWHATYMTAVFAYYGDESLALPYASYERNGARLIADNVTEDGLWRENSVSYHYYALSAATDYLAFLRRAEFSDGEAGRRIRDAFTGGGTVESTVFNAYLAPLKLLFPNGDMPATSDGWKYSLDSVRNAYVAVGRLFQGRPGAEVFAAAVRAGGAPEPSQDTLLYGLPENSDYDLYGQGPVHLSHNKMIMLRSGRTHAMLKYGNLCAGHSHPDALELMIYPFSVDPGSIAYGLPIHGEYFYVNGSHSTFMIDGRNQNKAASGTGVMSADGTSAEATVSDAYPEVTATRRVNIRGCEIDDEMTVCCDSERVIDWVFHGSGAFYTDAPTENAAGELLEGLIPSAPAGGIANAGESAGGNSAPYEPPQPNGYGYFKNVRRITESPEDILSGYWIYKGERLDIDLRAAPGSVIYLADTPDNPVTETRTAIVARVKATTAAVSAKFTLIRGTQACK